MMNLDALKSNVGNKKEKMRHSDFTCDKRSYRKMRIEYSAKLNKAKQLYYSELIDKC